MTETASGPGGDANADVRKIKAIHGKILEELNRSRRPYDDIVLGDCDGFSSKSFSDVEIKFLLREEKSGVLLHRLYKTDVIENFDGEQLTGCQEYLFLLEFLKDSEKDAESILKVFSSDPTETQVAAVLAVHLFAEMAPNTTVLLDRHMKGLKLLSNICPCGCNGEFRTGAIGIGSHEVWHGYPDIQVNKAMVQIALEERSDDESSEESAPSPEKRKKEEKIMSIAVEYKKGSLKPEAVVRQVIAEAITNSYAQTIADDQLKKKFLPSILISPNGVQIYIYNVEQDFLLSTPHLRSIFDTDGDGKPVKKLKILTVLEIWFAINVQLTGRNAECFASPFVSPDSRSGLSKSGFQEIVSERNALQFYKKAGRNIDAFPEKVGVKFSDLLQLPNVTRYLKPNEHGLGHIVAEAEVDLGTD